MIYNCHKGYLFVGQQRYEETLSIIKKRKIYFTINQITENTSNAKKYGLIKLFNIISSYSAHLARRPHQNRSRFQRHKTKL